jgi:hypothetical protein
MIITSDTTGAEFLRARIDEAKLLLPGLLVDTAKIAGDAVVEELSNASPVGEGGGPNPPGDAPGRLADSFSCIAERQADAGVAEVRCNQPSKLKFVREGRGWVFPVVRLALFWEGLPHPVKSARPSQPNDFVNPIIDSVSEIVEPEVQALVDELGAILEGA